MSEDYFIGVHSREIERLREQHVAWRPETHALWERAGFDRGQHLADLGSGPGFASLELAECVGPSGSVTAVDNAATYLSFLQDEVQQRGLPNIRTLPADITAVDVIEGPLDGAFCRFFLAFLVNDLDRVLSSIYRSLKPGGVFAAMEYLTLRSTTSSPPMRGFDAHTHAWIKYYSMHGGNTEAGSSLPVRLQRAGFTITHVDCIGGMARPSHRWWTWWGRLIADFGDKLVAEDLMPPDALRDLRSDWAEAGTRRDAFIYTPVLIQLVAQKVT